MSCRAVAVGAGVILSLSLQARATTLDWYPAARFAIAEQPVAQPPDGTNAPAPEQPAPPEQSSPPEQTPPAAVGEAGVKPTRGFLSALLHNLGDDVKHLPRRNSVYWLAGGTVVALAVHPEDGRVNRRLLGNTTADALFRPGKYIGNSLVLTGASALTYVVGRQLHTPRLQHLGMDELEAAILSEGVAELGKVIVRRERPMGPLGRQAGGYSMPSGHATITFAAATVLQQHLGYRAGIPTYLAASYVAVSRLHDNRHYLSDVAMGAALGVIVGRSVTYHGRNYWGGPVIVPGGIAFVIAKK